MPLNSHHGGSKRRPRYPYSTYVSIKVGNNDFGNIVNLHKDSSGNMVGNAIMDTRRFKSITVTRGYQVVENRSNEDLDNNFYYNQNNLDLYKYSDFLFSSAEISLITTFDRLMLKRITDAYYASIYLANGDTDNNYALYEDSLVQFKYGYMNDNGEVGISSPTYRGFITDIKYNEDDIVLTLSPVRTFSSEVEFKLSVINYINRKIDEGRYHRYSDIVKDIALLQGWVKPPDDLSSVIGSQDDQSEYQKYLNYNSVIKWENVLIEDTNYILSGVYVDRIKSTDTPVDYIRSVIIPKCSGDNGEDSEYKSVFTFNEKNEEVYIFAPVEKIDADYDYREDISNTYEVGYDRDTEVLKFSAKVNSGASVALISNQAASNAKYGSAIFQTITSDTNDFIVEGLTPSIKKEEGKLTGEEIAEGSTAFMNPESLAGSVANLRYSALSESSIYFKNNAMKYIFSPVINSGANLKIIGDPTIRYLQFINVYDRFVGHINQFTANLAGQKYSELGDRPPAMLKPTSGTYRVIGIRDTITTDFVTTLELQKQCYTLSLDGRLYDVNGNLLDTSYSKSKEVSSNALSKDTYTSYSSGSGKPIIRITSYDINLSNKSLKDDFTIVIDSNSKSFNLENRIVQRLDNRSSELYLIPHIYSISDYNVCRAGVIYHNGALSPRYYGTIFDKKYLVYEPELLPENIKNNLIKFAKGEELYPEKRFRKTESEQEISDHKILYDKSSCLGSGNISKYAFLYKKLDIDTSFESDSNTYAYKDKLGRYQDPWCAMFLCYILRYFYHTDNKLIKDKYITESEKYYDCEAYMEKYPGLGNLLLYGGTYSSSCESLENNFKNHPESVSGGKVGDIVFIHEVKGGRATHVGLVISEGKYISGNTTDPADRESEGVFIKNISGNVTYYTPNYDLVFPGVKDTSSGEGAGSSGGGHGGGSR